MTAIANENVEKVTQFLLADCKVVIRRLTKEANLNKFVSNHFDEPLRCQKTCGRACGRTAECLKDERP